jgi:hypothetical protein
MATITYAVTTERAEEVNKFIINSLVQPHYGIPFYVRTRGDGKLVYRQYVGGDETWRDTYGYLKAHGLIADLQVRDMEDNQ